MLTVLIKTAGIMLIIMIGYLMKRTGAFPASTAKVLSKVAIRILLPFVYICNLNGKVLSGELVGALLWGMGVNAVLIAAAVILSRKKPKETVFILQYCIPCFNTTGFALPVLQMFATEHEIASLVMFNLPITFSFFFITPLMIGLLTAGEHKVSLKEIGKGFLSNVAAMTSLAMMLLCLLRISIPDVVITAIRPIANANAAISLLALGLLFEFPKQLPKINITALAVRLAITLSAALLVWFRVIPFGEIRSAMILVLFAPIPNASPSLALIQGFEGSEVAFGVSANLLYSMVAVTVLCTLLF